MAELTPLDVKLGEVLGLAQAAQEATEAVARLAADHDDSVRRLETMRREEAETERRTLALLDRLGGQRPAAEAKGNEARTGAYGDDAPLPRRCRRRAGRRSRSSPWPRPASSATGRSSAR